MKRLCSLLLSIIVGITALSLPVLVNADEASEFQAGTYYQMGRYNGEPILWRCADNTDENGVLLVSDRILCFKAADVTNVEDPIAHGNVKPGSGFWEETNIRAWLNSTAPAGEVAWPRNNPPTADRIGFIQLPSNGSGLTTCKYPYADEKGFLADGNFTAGERSLMKSVSQWQMLPETLTHLATNGQIRPYISTYMTGNPRWGRYDYYEVTVDDLAMGEGFRGAMYRITDTMFLLNEPQVRTLKQNFGTACAKRTPSARPEREPSEEYESYWLRTSANANAYTEEEAKAYGTPDHGGSVLTAIGWEGQYRVHCGVEQFELGIRPGFYLNTENVMIKSGSGTETDPYVIDGREEQQGVAVFCQGKELKLDQEPVEENDRLLVPVRAIFESLGAEVSWDEAEEQVTATKESTTVQLQINSPTLLVNEEAVELDAPARLVGERTLVPLRAVSEALEAQVDYVENLQRVVIDKPAPQELDEDWNPWWYERAFANWDDDVK